MTDTVLVYGRYHTTSFIFIHVLRRLLTDFAEAVAGLHFHFVLDDRRDLEIARAALPADRVTVRPQYADLVPFGGGRGVEAETIRRWEREYGSPHLRCYIDNERALLGRPEGVKWRYLFSHIDYFERLAVEIRPIAYVAGAADGLNPWVAMQVFKARGAACLSFSPSRFGYRSFLLDNAYEVLDVREAYRRRLRDGLGADEAAAARAVLGEYRAGRAKPADHLAVRSKRRRIVPRPWSLLALWREAYATDTGNFDLPLPKAFARAVHGRRTGLRNLLLAARVTRSLPPDEPFFFFPLQFEPEISLGTQGRGWTSQLDLIRLISECLPVDRWLYVKEHPSMLSGIRPTGFYRAILGLPKVRLLDQRIGSYDVLPRAEAVLTITGTAGWEALMLGKPVVLFGHAFYEEFDDGVVRLDRPEDLPGVLRGLRGRGVPEAATLAYIAAVLSRAPEGIFIEPRTYPSVAATVLGDENIGNIAAVVARHLDACRSVA